MKTMYTILMALGLFILSVSPAYSANRELTVALFVNESDRQWDWLSKAIAVTLSDNLLFLKNMALTDQRDMQRIIEASQRDYFDDESNYFKLGHKMNTRFLVYGHYTVDEDILELVVKIIDISSNKRIKLFTLKKSLNKLPSTLRTLSRRVAKRVLQKLDDEDITFEKKAFRIYTRKNPKTIEYLYFYVKAWEMSLQEKSLIVLSYCRKALIDHPDDLNALLLMGRANYLRSDYTIALQHYKHVFRLAKKWRLRRFLTLSGIQMARIYNILGHYKKALKIYDRLYELNDELDDEYFTARIHMDYGLLFKSKGDYEKMYSHFNGAYKRFVSIRHKKGVGQSLKLLGLLYYTKGQNKKALDYYSRAFKIHDARLLVESKFQLFLNLGDLSRIRGRYDESLQYYFKAFRYAKRLHLQLSQTKALLGVSGVLDIKGQTEKAIELIYKVIKLKSRIHDKRGMARAYSSLGLIYYNQSAWDKSLKFHKKAFKIHRDLGLKSLLAKDYTNIGLIYNSKKDYDTAIQFYNKALKIRKKLDDKIGIAVTNNSFALVYINRDGDYEKAISIYKKSLQLMIGADYKEGIALSYWMMGVLYEKKGDENSAVKYYIKSRDIFLEMENPNHKNLQTLIDNIKNR